MASDDNNRLEYQEEVIHGKMRKVLVRRDEPLGFRKTEYKTWLKPNYDDWLKLPRWELNEAIFLLHDQQPKEPDCPRDENGDQISDEKTIIGFSSDMKSTLIMVQRSIVAKELSLHDGKYVEPQNFIKWAIDKNIPIPQKLNDFLIKLPDVEKAKVRKLSDNQRHRERCRAIAALIWSKEPKLTIADMGVRDEITVFGCEKKIYAENTIRKWINNLCPDRSPGRRTSG